MNRLGIPRCAVTKCMGVVRKMRWPNLSGASFGNPVYWMLAANFCEGTRLVLHARDAGHFIYQLLFVGAFQVKLRLASHLLQARG